MEGHYKIVNSKIIHYTKSVTAVFHQEGPDTIVLDELWKEGNERRRRKRRIRVKGY